MSPSEPAGSGAPGSPTGRDVAREARSWDEPGGRRSAEQWLGLLASVAAPTTLITALLYYFGYVATYAKFAYFAVDVDSLGYADSDYVLRSAAALFVPIMALLLIGGGGYLAHRLIRSHVARHQGTRRLRIAGWIAVGIGLALFSRGVVGVIDPTFGRTEAPTVTPLALAIGAGTAGYGAWALQFSAVAERAIRLTRQEKVVAALLAGIMVFALFWVTNTVAAAYGRGEALRIASDPSTRPGVVMDTTERLYIPIGTAAEQLLPSAPGQQFHYRYAGFRLLTVTGDGWLLMSQSWTQQNGFVLVVPRDSQVRVRLLRS